MKSMWEWDVFGIKGIDASSFAALSCCCNCSPGNGMSTVNRVSGSRGYSRGNAEIDDSKCGVGIYFYADETGALVISSLDSEGANFLF